MRRMFPLLLLLIGFAACSSPAAPTSAPTVLPTSAPTATSTTPDWLSLPFTEAKSNQPMTLASFKGKTVYVEAMAAWCTNCKNQQRQVVEARKSFGDDVVFISIGVDPNENAPQLAKYAVDQGFDWTFGQATPELINKWIVQFGRTITNPPSTPIFIISPSGKVSELYTNGHSADDLVKLIKQQQAAT